MPTPVNYTYKISKDQFFKLIDATIDSSDFLKKGQNKSLGLMSIDIGKDYMLYLHIVETEVEQTEVSVAPGFPFMKDRDQSELPAELINGFIQNLNNSIDT